MSVVQLGSRTVTGTVDEGNNPYDNAGNWTAAFTPALLAVAQQSFEVFHIVVSGAAGSSFLIYIDGFFWDNVSYGQANSWDPVNPMPVKTGQTVYFYYSDSASDGTPPTVTLWLRAQT